MYKLKRVYNCCYTYINTIDSTKLVVVGRFNKEREVHFKIRGMKKITVMSYNQSNFSYTYVLSKDDNTPVNI